jgi:hypothetical protein
MNKGGIVFLSGLFLIASAACSSSSNSLVADAGTSTGSCSSPVQAEDSNLKQCAGCTAMQSCTPQAPVEACCTWTAVPDAPLARPAQPLHRYYQSGAPDLSCLASAPSAGTSQMVTLTGYVWLFASGLDSSGVKVEVFKENNPNTDGSIGAMVGSYTTKMTDPAYPQDTTWSSKCPSGCQFRQYTIPNVPTETALIIKTSDTGSGMWATLYDYNVFFASSAVSNGMVTYDATAAAATDLGVVAGTVGLTPDSSKGMLAGEVHDCADVRVSGATVGTSVPPEGQVFYLTGNEGNPLPDQSAHATSDLSLFGGINYPTGTPIRVTAVARDPAASGKDLMLGTYVVQVYPGAVTALALRGRRPWQP